MKLKFFVRLVICGMAGLISGIVPCARAQAPAPPAAAPADGKAYEAAISLMQEQKWKEAMSALESWVNQYGKFSPRANEAKYNLALCYLHQEKPMHDDASRLLRELIKEPPEKVPPASKEQFQLLIAKASTMKAFEMPADTEVQKTTQVRMIEIAIKEYDTFLTTYPNSRGADSGWFFSGALSLAAEKWDDSVKRFKTVYEKYPKSLLRMPSLMNIGKTFVAQGFSLLAGKGGKEASDDEIKQALAILESSALASLTAVYQQSGDLALMNESVFFIGQIQLTRALHVTLPDEEAKKKRQQELFTASLDAFRAVRSREEVIQEQDRKITELRKSVSLLNPANQAEYVPMKNYYENLIQMEEDKKKKFLDETDQFLGARMAIARIFLFLKKPDESRALIRYLQGQKEVFAAEKNKVAVSEAQAQLAATLCHTYIEQKNVEKSAETAEAFRTAFKGNEAGENIPLLLANLYLEKNKVDKAEEVIRVANEDYKPWHFGNESVTILVNVAINKGDFEKAASLVDGLLSNNPRPEVEADMLFLKGTILHAMASQKHDDKKADEAFNAFQTVRDKFPNSPKAEDAWFEQGNLTVGRAPAKARPELEKFIDQYGKGGSKSENTPKNLPVAQFLLAKVLDALSQQNPPAAKPDDALTAYRSIIEKWPESDPASGAYFKMYDIHAARKEYNTCVKLLEEFIQKYPKHENVFYAFNYIAEILFNGSLKAKGPDGKAGPVVVGIADVEAGVKKLREFVDYELALTPDAGKELPPRKGDGSMIKAADRWQREIVKLPPYITLTNDQKLIYQKCVDGMKAAIDKLMASYPESPRYAEGLEFVVTAETALLKARQIDVPKGRTYFKELQDKYGKSPDLQAKIMLAEAAFLNEPDPVEAKKLRDEAFKKIPIAAAPAAAPGTPPPPEGTKVAAPKPRFSPPDYDKYFSDLFDAKKFDEITANIGQMREEYPLDEKTDPATVSAAIRDARAIGLFWEGKVLAAQGKTVDAGKVFEVLKQKFPKSDKVFEADFGILQGAFAAGKDKVPADFEVRLATIIKNTSSNGAKSFELPAKAVLLTAQIQAQRGEYESAVANFLKIHDRYASVPKIAAEGLWEAAQILEKQGSGELKIRTRAELEALSAENAKKRKESEEAGKKSDAAKPAGTKADDKKPADGKKPADSDKAVGDKKPADGKDSAKPTTTEGAKPTEKTTAKAEPEKK